MSLYEHVVITRPDVSSSAVEEFVQNLASKIENMGGTVEGAEYWGLRNLAYRMNKNRKAHYSLLKVNAHSDVIHEIERTHRINEDILRYMSIRVDEFNEDPSPILKSAKSVNVEIGTRSWLLKTKSKLKTFRHVRVSVVVVKFAHFLAIMASKSIIKTLKCSSVTCLKKAKSRQLASQRFPTKNSVNWLAPSNAHASWAYCPMK